MMPTFSGEAFAAWLQALVAWLTGDVFTPVNIIYTVIQVPAVVGAGFTAWWMHDFVYPLLVQRIGRSGATDYAQYVMTVLASLLFPGLWALGLWLATLIAFTSGWPHDVVWIALNLLLAWIVVRLATILVRDPVWGRIIALTAYTIAALNVLGLLDPAAALLDHFALTIGDFRVSLLTVLRGMISFGVLLWLAMLISKMLERRVHRLPNITPSLQVLVGKVLKATLVALAVVLAFTSIGLDVTALAVFGGGLGLGLGFGLQKIVSNMISGIIILADRSIKPGDIIQIGGTYGWVASLGARYVSIETRDGEEFLVPNEDIITQQVVNWSHRDDYARIKVAVQVPFTSDLDQALALLLQAAEKPKRVVRDKEPKALITDFVDGRAELELRFWIRDVQNGIRNVSSEVRHEIWRLFREHGLVVPIPRRDITLSRKPASVEP